MLHRYPTGVAGEKVHQKRLPHGAPPWMETVQVFFPRYKRTADELCVTELAHVIWAVQMSTVEFHPWNSRRADVEKPDEWRIDLDPMPDAALRSRCSGSPRVAHEVLDELGATGWPKTSGGSGLHIYVRIEPDARVRRRAPRGARLRPRGRKARAAGCDHDLVAQGSRSGGRLRRLQPERARPHHRVGVLGARQPRGDRVDTDSLGRGRAMSTRATSRSRPCRPASPPLGDLHAGIDEAVFDIAPLLEWAERDEAEGAEVPPEPEEA